MKETEALTIRKIGGAFVEGYTAPSNYDEPVTELPGAEKITKAGYEFAGWYDNEEFNGEPVNLLSTADHTGSVVLYANGRNVTIMWIFHRRSMRMGISLR